MIKPYLLLAAFALQAEVPIACNLNALTPPQRQTLKSFSDRASHAVIDSRDLPDGYGFRFDSTQLSLTDVAAGVDLWRKCCPFYEFEIQLRGEGGSLWLNLRGRKGVKEYFPIDAPQLAAKLPKPSSR
ncbi:MAG: hypothetical protein JWP63_426 [Candidatus Solibacter sp.]|nr:hypothetical protein [Candidatus Solibacter sp.]